MEKYFIDGQYGALLEKNGIKLTEVLKKADLPQGIFCSERVMMTSEEYRRFMDAIGVLSPSPKDFIKLATGEGIELFSPPVFAAYCSKNGQECIERLGRYKRLIGPMEYRFLNAEDCLTVQLISVDDQKLSDVFVLGEFLFLVNLFRKATKENIYPKCVKISGKITAIEYTRFFGTEIQESESNEIIFVKEDLIVPFISENKAMWEYFEPELNKRLAEMEIDDTISAKVRSAISELLPAGKCAIDDVANELGISKRSLQRRLSEEETTFQKQLNATREVLAKHYLKTTSMNVNDIAFLLGYQEVNSFLRAFNSWTGINVSEYRRVERK